MATADASDIEAPGNEEYDVGLGDIVAGGVEVVEVDPTMASDTVDPESIHDRLGGEADGSENFVDEKDLSGNEYVEYLEVETLDGMGTSAASVKDESLNSAMLNVSIDENDTIESNTSDCVITSAYYAYNAEREDTNTK